GTGFDSAVAPEPDTDPGASPNSSPVTSRRKNATSIPARVGRITAAGCETGTSRGTARTRQPAAAALATPAGESSMATHDAAGTPSDAAARWYGSGCGFACRTSSPVTTTS